MSTTETSKTRGAPGVLTDQARGFRTAFGAVFRFRRHVLQHWRALLAAALLSIAYGAARIAEPWPLKFIFDNVLDDRPLETPIAWLDRLLADDRTRILFAASAAIVLLALLRSILYFYQRILTTRAAQEIVAQVQRELFAHLQRLSLSFHHRNRTGDLMTRLTGDVVSLRELLVSTLLYLLAEGGVLIGLIVVMFLVEWRLALVSVGVMPVVFLFMAFYAGRIRKVVRKQRRREGRLAGQLHENVSGIHIVQMFTREDEEDARLANLNKKLLKDGLKATRLEAQLNRAVELSVGVATAAVMWVGATQVIAGRLTPGELIVFVAYMQSFYRPLRRISRITQRAARASASLERVTALLDEQPELRDGHRTARPFAGDVRFEQVDFQYVEGESVLRGIDLDVAAGQTVALVGHTGAGKSTLVNLVPRLYDAGAGTVRIDGVDVREFTLKSLREQITIVPQDGMLFAGTFRDNIAYGKSSATDKQIEAAARAALIHDFIAGLPEGYETLIGERGVTLSGGQRQRVAIARAIARDAPIVVLDEPTTGLDAESEHLVLTALDHLLEGRTAFMIAHKFSTIQRADLIVVMEHGRIVEAGSHSELMSLQHYRRLHELQTAKPEAAEGFLRSLRGKRL